MEINRFVQIEPVGPRTPACAPDDGANRTVPNMDFNLYCRLVDQLPEMTDLRLQGRGEPLLHLHLFDMVRYAVERGILVSMTTGLTALSQQRAEECVHSGLYKIHVMIDAAATPLTTSDPIQQRHLRVLRNLRRLMEARSRLQCLQPEVALTAALDHRDLPRLPALVRFAHDEGIGDITVEIGHGSAGIRALSPLANAFRQRNAFNEAQGLAQALGVTLHALRPAPDRAAVSGLPGVCISYSGETVSCEVLPAQHNPAPADDFARSSRERPPVGDLLSGAAG